MNPAPATPQLYTAARIAAALGQKRQAVRWHLREVAPSGKVLVNGVAADAWNVAALPAQIREPLAAAVKRRGYRDIEHLLSSPPGQWQPKIPLAEVSLLDLDKAAKLMKALGPSLGRQADLSLSAAEFERLGVEDYKRVFGHGVSTRYFRELFKRTIYREIGRAHV